MFERLFPICLGIAALVCVGGHAAPAHAQSDLQARLQAHISHLASPNLEGRGNAGDGLVKARDYIADQMEQIGLEPGGTDGYFSPLEAVTRAELSRQVSLQIGEQVLAEGVEFTPASFSDSGGLETEAVFVGYGLSAPSVGYDDYAGVDVRGKTVIALRGAPETHESALRNSERGYLLSSGSKAAVALANGARALILVNDPRGHGERSEQRADELPALRPALALEGLAVAHLTARAAGSILEQLDLDLAELQDQIDNSGEPHSRPLALEVRADLSIERETRTIYNVVGLLPHTAESPSSALVVTAHYDGLGFGHAGSLADEPGIMHPGADDNASGVAVVLETARRMAARSPSDRPVVFATPAGEELGLRGSRRLARQLLDRYDGGTAVNLDMVGRLRAEGVRIAQSAHGSELAAVVERAARRADLRVRTERLDERITDHISFVELGFRGLNLTTGRHGDYHVPGDTLDKLNWAGLVRMTRFLEAVLLGLA